MQKYKVAIVGLGTVGTGVARILIDNSERTARHAGGRRLWLEKAVVRDLKKSRDVKLPPGCLSDDLTQITSDPDIVAVAHLVGGLEPARTIMLKLLESGKDVITANKALLAEYGPELFDRARELGRTIAFEAAVAGGIPIIANISQCLAANQILSLHGILNGTSNFILTAMESAGMDYNAAVKEAQRLGYAEADPTLDVDGTDAAQKLAILAHLAFGARVHWKDIPRRGIDELQMCDLKYAKELGYRIKLLAVAQLAGTGVELHVSPTLVRIGSPLGEVRDAYNAVSVVGDAVGKIFFHGLGAGQMPTASAVVADLIDTIVGRTKITFSTLEPWVQREAAPKLVNFADVEGRYFLRFNVADVPGVLAEIAGALGRQGISISSVIQHEPPTNGENVVPLIFMTHNTTEGAVTKALGEIHTQKSVRGPCVKLRVRN